MTITLPDIMQTSSFGLINSLQTENIIFNVIIALLIPVLINMLTGSFSNIQEHLENIWAKLLRKDYIYRSINLEINTNQYGEFHVEGNDNTTLLQKAVTLYINNNFPSNYDEGEYKFVDSRNECSDSDSDDEDCVNEDDIYRNNSLLRQLKKNTLVTHPEKKMWVKLSPIIEYKRILTEKNGSDDSKKFKSIIVSLVFRNSVIHGREVIDNFINDAIKWYEDDVKSKNKQIRYMYMLKNLPEKSQDKQMNFKRYTLGANKTFDTIFMPNKAEILHMINDFQSNQGKFAIAGFPKQLNILLTGPPGTGKSSLVKAISQYTNRHIIEIPISKITSNQTLYDIIFGRNFYREEEGYADKHGFSRTIFVIEDIDCVSDIVYKRVENEEKRVDVDAGSDREQLWKQLLNIDNTGNIKNDFKYSLNNDPLTLSGILNVIDGIIECPKRILIITTNHPEKLDPALVRPGRINIKLYLGYIQAQEAIQMISHYVMTLTKDEEMRVEEIFSMGVQVSPAYLEKLCIEYNNIRHILDMLLTTLDDSS